MDTATETIRGTCVVCQSPITPGEAAGKCPACAASYHKECWNYNGGCGVYGCEKAANTENLKPLEIPAAYWGQEEKACPVCGGKILAAAVRCRHCGTMFATSRPVDTDQYRAGAAKNVLVAAAERTGRWILVLGLIPCTAPLAAMFGLPWFLRRRQEIAAMHGSSAAMCKIGVGAACAQTALIIVLSIVYALMKT